MKNKFIRFLKYRILWSKFKRDFNDYNDPSDKVMDYLNYMDEHPMWIINFMDYDVSDFWISINKQWHNYLKNDRLKTR